MLMCDFPEAFAGFNGGVGTWKTGMGFHSDGKSLRNRALQIEGESIGLRRCDRRVRGRFHQQKHIEVESYPLHRKQLLSSMRCNT